MRTTVTVRCSECDHADSLDPADVRLIICPHHAQYLFRCRNCDTTVTKHAESAVVRLLREAGVKQVVVTFERGEGPAIDEDELIRVGLALEALPNGVPAQRATAAQSRTRGTGSALQP